MPLNPPHTLFAAAAADADDIDRPVCVARSMLWQPHLCTARSSLISWRLANTAQHSKRHLPMQVRWPRVACRDVLQYCCQVSLTLGAALWWLPQLWRRLQSGEGRCSSRMPSRTSPPHHRAPVVATEHVTAPHHVTRRQQRLLQRRLAPVGAWQHEWQRAWQRNVRTRPLMVAISRQLLQHRHLHSPKPRRRPGASCYDRRACVSG